MDLAYVTQTCYVSYGGCSVNLTGVPVPGIYSVIVTPQSSGTGTFGIQVVSDATGTLTVDTPLAFTLKSGQNGRYTFTGAVGDSVALELSQVTTLPAGRTLTAYVYRPTDAITTNGNGVFVGQWQITSTNTATTLPLPALPSAGTYTVIVDTGYQETANGTLTLQKGQPLVLEAAPQNATISHPGESVRYTLTGVVGQNLGIGLTNLVLSGATYGTLTVYQPGGAVQKTQSCYTSYGGCSLNLNNLPVAGTYSVLFSATGATGSFSIEAHADATGTLVTNTPLPVTMQSGQNARLTFTGAVNDVVTLTFTQVSTVPSGRTLTAYVYRPTDTVTTNGNGIFIGNWKLLSFSTAGGTLSLGALPTAGTYTVIIDTGYQETANVTVTKQ
jgi:hypothetical protein